MADPRKPAFQAVVDLCPRNPFDIAGNIARMHQILDDGGAPGGPAEEQERDALPEGHLSANFTLAEMTVSETAARKGIRNVPGPEEIRALTLLCNRVLEPVRAHFGRPVIVTSGYRSPRLNTAVGGSTSSQHCKGEAADFRIHGVPNIDVIRWIWRNLNYDQLIYEFGEAGWIHCSFSASRMRNMELTAKKIRGRTRYLTGIVT